jgi:hypothetical protein
MGARQAKTHPASNFVIPHSFSHARASKLHPAATAHMHQTTNEGLDAMATNDPRAAAAAAPVPTKVTPIRENTPEKAELIRLAL